MSRLIFDASTLGGTTTLSSEDAVGNFTIDVPAVTGTMLIPATVGLANQVLTSNATAAPTWQYLAGTGTVTSISGSGGTTGLTLTGGPITSSGTLTLGGTLAIANGGTGATTDSAARTALGLGTMSTQAASAVAITGGAIDGTTVGSTTVAAGSFTTLNSSGNTRLGGLSGNQSLQVNNVASAVNYAQIVGAITTGAPVLSVQGTDTNIGLVLQGKGTGLVALGGSTVANSAAQFVTTTSGVNFLQFTGGATGVSPSFVSSGTDASVGFNISTKGNANVAFFTNNFSNFSFVVKNVASAVNYLISNGAATGNSPSFAVDGSDTNINLTLTPKGTGVVSTTSLTLSNTLTTAAYTETITASGTVGASATLAITAGTILTATLTSATACTFTMPTATAGKSFTLLLKQPASGTATTATFTGVKWNAGGAPTITATVGKLDIIAFVADGTSWYGTASQGYTY
jgi:hypothetical protein